MAIKSINTLDDLVISAKQKSYNINVLGSGLTFDTLEGSDTVKITGSNNTVNTLGGKDIVSVFSSGNTINTGDGNDIITINASNNTVDAGLGYNKITVNGNENTITAGEGNDTITVSGDNNVLNIGAGNDSVYIKAGADNKVISAGGTNKIIVDWKYVDNVNLSIKDDSNDNIVIKNAKFEDFVISGNKKKTYVSLPKPGGTANIVEGYNNIILINGSKVIEIELSSYDASNQKHWNYYTNSNTVTIGKFKMDYTFLDNLRNGTYLGTDNANKIIVNQDDLQVKAKLGNDSVTANNKNNLKVFLEAGKNTVTMVGGDNNIVHGGAGDKVKVTGGSNFTYDLLQEQLNKDTITLAGVNGTNITTGNGKDVVTISGVIGENVINTGLGNDTITINWIDAKGNVVVDGGEGKNVLNIKGAGFNDFAKSIVGNDLLLTNGENSITVKNWNDGNFANIKFADGKKSKTYINTVISLKKGYADVSGTVDINADRLQMGKTNYTLPAGMASVDGNFFEVRGGDTADTIKVTGGNRINVASGAGNDIITVSAGSANTIDAGEGADKINITGGTSATAKGGAGNDIITVSSAVAGANYTIGGGEGKDTYKLTKLAQNATYTIDNGGSVDGDVLDFSNYKVTEFNVSSINGEPGTVKLEHIPTNSITYIRGLETSSLEILFKGYKASFDTVQGVLSGEPIYEAPPSPYNAITLNGTSGADTISNNGVFFYVGSTSKKIADSSKVQINGLDGDDTILVQNRGECRIYGDGGADTIMVITNPGMSNSGASIKNVYLDGGSGNDTISTSASSGAIIKGGIGNDSISIMQGNSSNSYANGETGNDEILFSDITNSIAVGGAGEDKITLNVVDHCKVYGGDDSDTIVVYNDSSYNYLDGGVGNDYFEIIGGTHNTLVGGAGYDRYSVDHRVSCYIKVTDSYDTLNIVAYNGAANYYKINNYTSTYDSSRDIMKISFGSGAICVEGFSKLSRIYLGSNDITSLGSTSYTASGYISAAQSAGKYATANLANAMLSFGENGASVDVASLGNTLEPIYSGIKNEILKVTGSN